ncbi:PD40 domain-containing protein [bacterium]|nr:PD40 domain-containing protein [bacterium]
MSILFSKRIRRLIISVFSSLAIIGLINLIPEKFFSALGEEPKYRLQIKRLTSDSLSYEAYWISNNEIVFHRSALSKDEKKLPPGGDGIGYDPTDIWKINVNTGEEVHLISNAVLISPFYIKIKGTKEIFFHRFDGHRGPVLEANESSNDIWVMNPDGSNPHLFLRPLYYPFYFSDDGQKIAYETSIREPVSISISDFVSQKTKNVPIPFAYGLSGLDWSPDGQKLVIGIHNKQGCSHIWMLDIETEKLTQLTDLGENFYESGPEFSSNNKEILFQVSRYEIEEIEGHPYLVSFKKEKARNIWKMNADGTNQIQLTTKDTQDFYVTWSPDGKRIAFCSGYPEEGVSIWIMAADGSRKTQVIENGGSYPNWSPDSTKLVFTVREPTFGWPDIWMAILEPD